MHECAIFCESRVIVCLAGFVSLCLPESDIFSREYFMGQKLFLVGISWVQNFFSCVSRGPQIFSQGYFFESEIIFLRVFHVIFITNITAVHIHLARPLKLTSHSILHYLWSANLSKNFSQLCQYGFYLFSVIFHFFARWKSLILPRIACIVIHSL